MTDSGIRGPWFVMPNGVYVGDKKVWFDDKNARCGDTPNWIVDCGTEERAALIAAAPDLLNALIQMVVNSEGDKKQYRDCHKKAVAAIAKATGKA